MRDRIVELRRVAAGELRANPANWRTHPPEQRTALATVLEDVGLVDAVIARDTPEGLELIDGHLRADLAADEVLPVLIVDLTDDEAATVLATYDPIGALAVADVDRLADLVESIGAEPMDYSSLYGTLAPVELIEVADAPAAGRENGNMENFKRERTGAFLSIRGEVTPLGDDVVTWLGDDPGARLEAAAAAAAAEGAEPF